MNILAQNADVEDFLSGEMKRLSASGNLTKRTAVRLAIANAITTTVSIDIDTIILSVTDTDCYLFLYSYSILGTRISRVAV